jgi:RHS repeat-associated protein
LYIGGCDIGYTGHLTVPSPVTGQTETVLTHFRAYDPEFGRWLSADPLGEAGGMNIYAYCYGNPLNLYDPDGMFPSAAWWGGFFDVDASEVAGNFALGAMATADGFIPFSDPFKEAGGYSGCEDGAGLSNGAAEVAQFAATSLLSGGGVSLISRTSKAKGIVLSSKSTGGWRSRIHTLRSGSFGKSYEAYARQGVLRLEGHPWGAGAGRIPGLKSLGKYLGMRPHLHLDFMRNAPHHLSLEPLFGGTIRALDEMSQGGDCP